MSQAHALAQMHNIVEDQLATQKQLSAVYTKWLAQVQLQHGIVGHLALQSLSWIAFLVLLSVLLSTGVRTLLDRSHMDRRLLRTALLETGNWTDKGHPTGRRVSFINKFAIAGQYFNFSTTGQWMWDEITVNIPPGADTYKTIDSIHDAVVKETEKDASLAEREWRNSTSHNGLGQFKAAPSVDMRPPGSGVDLGVRYVPRAGDRFDFPHRLHQA